jgi:trimeric autotransporter adhesin
MKTTAINQPITSSSTLAFRLPIALCHNCSAKVKRQPLLAVLIVLGCFSLLPKALAVSPPPDGGYPGGNTAEGERALLSLTSGTYNTAVGFLSLVSNVTGNFSTATGAGTLLANTADADTATGAGALLSNTTGGPNTANGAFALFSNTTGNNNNAFGFQALFGNTTGPFNNAFGNGALSGNTTGDRNTAMGEGALLANTTGFKNIAIGVSALRNNGAGHDNIAIGQDACSQSQGGQFNTAVGSNALVFNTADGNTAIGADALFNNHSGVNNTATGVGALESNSGGMDNTADGLNALSGNAGNDNTALGFGAGAAATTGSNNVYIGAGMVGVAGESNACYIASIFGQSVDPTDDLAVFVDGHGKLGTTVSSRRFKDGIKPMAEASEAIMAFKPVTFHYKGDLKNTPQYGLIAEEVAKVNPHLVARDRNGEIMSVHYDQVWNMLLNEFLKEHKNVQEQETTMTQMKKEFESKLEEQQKEIEALRLGLQQVGAQIEISKPTSQMVSTNP